MNAFQHFVWTGKNGELIASLPANSTFSKEAKERLIHLMKAAWASVTTDDVDRGWKGSGLCDARMSCNQEEAHHRMEKKESISSE